MSDPSPGCIYFSSCGKKAVYIVWNATFGGRSLLSESLLWLLSGFISKHLILSLLSGDLIVTLGTLRYLQVLNWIITLIFQFIPFSVPLHIVRVLRRKYKIGIFTLFNSWVGFFCSFAGCISHKSLENNWNYKFKGCICIKPSYEAFIQIHPLNL